jgi:hypothetical protein
MYESCEHYADFNVACVVFALKGKSGVGEGVEGGIEIERRSYEEAKRKVFRSSLIST